MMNFLAILVTILIVGKEFIIKQIKELAPVRKLVISKPQNSGKVGLQIKRFRASYPLIGA